VIGPGEVGEAIGEVAGVFREVGEVADAGMVISFSSLNFYKRPKLPPEPCFDP
jgi:hypothetical protein